MSETSIPQHIAILLAVLTMMLVGCTALIVIGTSGDIRQSSTTKPHTDISLDSVDVKVLNRHKTINPDTNNYE